MILEDFLKTMMIDNSIDVLNIEKMEKNKIGDDKLHYIC